MKNRFEAPLEHRRGAREDEIYREIRRAGARLNHFRGVAVSVLDEARKILLEIWVELQDARTCEEILEDGKSSCRSLPEDKRSLLLEKLNLLGAQIDYARRLCDGSIGKESQEEGDQ